MFETSRAQTSARGRVFFFGMLPISVAAHALAATGLILMNVWTVAFPSDAPAQFLAFAVADTPPPPPPPPPPAASPVQKVVPVQTPTEIVAPTVIPDEIPVITRSLPQVTSAAGVPGGVEGGVEGGQIGGIIGGVVGGVLVAEEPEPATPPPPPAVPDDGRVHIERDEKLGLAIISQPDPPYPFSAVAKRLQDTLVVRYVIGKNGRVKEVSVISPPQNEIFVRGTLNAIRRWQFKPLVKDGERREVVHELTVHFRLMDMVPVRRR
ncbi:MAG TPA: energy transducer TonB [Thermoanaerobaculia bacterium]|nr:energy transducer TonB [Thermoanaerobaculia bacterium]